MTVEKSLLDAAKMAKRVMTDAYDQQIKDLLYAGMLDLGVAGVEMPEICSDPLVRQALITYFLMNFGEVEPNYYDRLERSYIQQKAQLATCTGYTDWLGADHEQT